MTAAQSARRLASDAPEIIITCVRRDETGTWTAHVSVQGQTYEARRHGGWQLHDPGRDCWIFPLPSVAARLAEKVRRLEDSELKALIASLSLHVGQAIRVRDRYDVERSYETRIVAIHNDGRLIEIRNPSARPNDPQATLRVSPREVIL